ncbi:MAG: double-strand break repair helicase AddA [Rhizobiaceae bacterium]|nr:double-strand break repair helicase AddA [Rhizobiaceae bacterium]
MTKKLQIPKTTLDEQFSASDPKRFVWVSANAGSGKTHVLTQRVIRLMLDGNSPDKILCLTFTKAAAANMKNRIFDTLAKWTMMPDKDLKAEIHHSTGSLPSGKALRRARQLFAEALDTPGGLKVQTIHAFCEALLHQFPLEANVSGHFEVIQETTQAAMLAEAKAKVLGNPQNSYMFDAFSALVPTASDASIEMAISEIIANRHAFQDWVLDMDQNSGDVDLAVNRLYPIFGIRPDDTEDEVRDTFIKHASQNAAYFAEVQLACNASDKKTDIELGKKLEALGRTAEPSVQFNLWVEICLTQKGDLRSEKSIATAAIKKQFPDLVETILSTGSALLKALDKITAIRTINNTRNLFKIAFGVLEQYERMKRARGQIDYDDQIWKTVNLLKRPDIRDWIRYRLDNGVDHVLVDEAQDTSPAQWEIINAVTEDFYAGESASKKERSVFVVGDEKQSIYSFQGADPKEFDLQKRLLDKQVTALGKSLKKARLDLSFRSTKDVLHAVDLVFENEANANGLTQNGEAPVHDAVRANDPGEVQVWPVFAREKTEKTESWIAPIDRESVNDPAVLLAERIATSIGEWVGKPLPGTGEPLRFGDILVLVRKRDRFITALTRTLKDKGLAVAGADRLRLLEHIAVEDLLAMGRFALLPEDDLNLAAVLKGVFIGMSDTQLFEIAHDRGPRTLFEQLRFCSEDSEHAGNEAASAALPVLEEIRAKEKSLGLFEFYAWLFGAHGGRKKLLAQLGMEAEDVLDAFVDEIIAFVRDGGSGLEAFIAMLTKADPEIKRELELDRDEVRILTVHASKGLEAKVVFLVDSCGSPWISSHRSKVLEVGDRNPNRGFVWVPTSTDQTSVTRKITEDAEAAANAEYRRLLYVGMTRAADRLIVCGYRGTRDPKHDYWHRMVENTLTPSATPIPEELGGGIRWVKEERAPVPMAAKAASGDDETPPTDLPEWLHTPAKADPPLPRPLTPSGAYALIDEALKEQRHPAFEQTTDNSPFALKIGNMVHQLLEVLPDVSPDKRLEKAQEYVSSKGKELPKTVCDHVLQTIEILFTKHPFRDVFDAESRAEVPLIGSLQTRSGLRLLSGQIDRLIMFPDRVMILDYKTNKHIPSHFGTYPPEYITQLALYRHLITQIYPSKNVECALLWTSGPELAILPDEILTAALETVKNG